MHILIIGPILSIFIILIPFVKSISRFNQFFSNTEDAISLTTPDSMYQSILDVNDSYEVNAAEKELDTWEFPELLFMGIAPPLGVFLIYYFYKDIQPFHIDYAPALGVYIFIGYVSYWLSRYCKKHVSISFAAILPYGIAIGILLYCILFIHFISGLTLLGGAVFPFFGFPLFAPLPALLYSTRELKLLTTHLHQQTDKSEYSSEQQSSNLSFAKNLLWQNNIENWGFLIVLIFIIQAVLYLFGFPFESIWLALREGEGFLFSLNSAPF